MAFHSVMILSSRPGRTREATRGGEQRPGGFDLRWALEGATPGQVQDRPAFEVALRRDAVPFGRLRTERGPEHRAQLLGRPHVEASFLALGVGILCRVKASAFVAEVAEHVRQGLGEHLEPARIAVDLPGVQIDPSKERLVVQHLLEVWHVPVGVDRVAGEPPAEMVVDAPGGHCLEGAFDHVERPAFAVAEVIACQQVQEERLGEFRGGAESPVYRVEHGREPCGGFGAQLVRGLRAQSRGVGRFPRREAPRDRVRQKARLADDIVPARIPGLGDGVEQLTEGGQPMAGAVGEVCARKKREPVRGGEDAHRPTAAAGRSLHRLHVDRVYVRPLLPVDLHAHEMPVHHLRSRRVREGLVTHDVAPVARGVADRDEKRPVKFLRARERFVAPRVPVDRIAGVLAQVGAFLDAEPVHLRPPSSGQGDAFTLRNLWS